MGGLWVGLAPNPVTLFKIATTRTWYVGCVYVNASCEFKAIELGACIRYAS